MIKAAMNVRLKKIKFFEGHDTMQGMSADVWINGVKCMHVFDSAHGGGFEYNYYISNNPKPAQVKQNIADLEAHIKSLPKQELNYAGKIMMVSVDMDGFIDDLLNKQEKEKQEKKKLKLMQTAILFGIPNGDRYSYLSYKRPLSTIPLVHMQHKLNVIVLKYCKDNIVILNTNLNQLGLVIN